MKQFFTFLATKINAESNDVTYGQVVLTLVALTFIAAFIIIKAQRETSKN